MGFFLQIRFCTGLAFSRFNGAREYQTIYSECFSQGGLKTGIDKIHFFPCPNCTDRFDTSKAQQDRCFTYGSKPLPASIPSLDLQINFSLQFWTIDNKQFDHRNPS